MLALILGSALALAAVLGARRAARALSCSPEPLLPLYRNAVAGAPFAMLDLADGTDCDSALLTIADSASALACEAIAEPSTPVLSPVLTDDDGASTAHADSV